MSREKVKIKILYYYAPFSLSISSFTFVKENIMITFSTLLFLIFFFLSLCSHLSTLLGYFLHSDICSLFYLLIRARLFPPLSLLPSFWTHFCPFTLAHSFCPSRNGAFAKALSQTRIRIFSPFIPLHAKITAAFHVDFQFPFPFQS